MSFPHSRGPAHEADRAGGAYVRRRITMGERDLMTGAVLTAEEVAAIPRANLNALINTGRLELFPASPFAPADGAERFAIHLGFGRYDVVEGRKLTAEPVTKEQAEALAGPTSTEH